MRKTAIYHRAAIGFFMGFRRGLGAADCSYFVLVGHRRHRPAMLFDAPEDELTDEEIAPVLRQSVTCAGRLSRHADVTLAGVCAEHLVDGLRAAGLIVAWPSQWRLHP